MLADSPLFHYRLGEPAGTATMTDASPNGVAGTYSATTATGSTATSTAGAPVGDGDAGPALDGSTTRVMTEQAAAAPSVFSVELWFHTTTTTGGILAGYGDGVTAGSGSLDRMLYVDSGRRLTFGVYDGSARRTVRSTATVNDGAWHHVVGSYSTASTVVQLWLDGVSQGTTTSSSASSLTGYWYVGGDASPWFWLWPNAPGGNRLAGAVDEVAVYPAVLSGARVAAHVAANTGTAYRSAVLADSPSVYWRLNEATGATRAADAAGTGRTGAYHGGPAVAAGRPGAMVTPVLDTAVRFGPLANGYHPTPYTSPNTCTVEVWFRTTTTFGGSLANFGSKTTGASDDRDRALYLRADGRLAFFVYPPSSLPYAITSAAAYNDGAWHLATGSLGPAGLRLYADGVLVAQDPAVTTGQNFTGYWRVGHEAMTWTPNSPPSESFAGDLDDFAVYGTQLSAARIAAHHAAR